MRMKFIRFKLDLDQFKSIDLMRIKFIRLKVDLNFSRKTIRKSDSTFNSLYDSFLSTNRTNS